MTKASEYLAVAALLMLEGKPTVPTDRSELAEQFTSTYSYACDDAAIDVIVRYLRHWGAISIHEDQFAGETFRIFNGTVKETVNRLRESELEELISSGKYEGARWFKRVFDHRHFWERVYEERSDEIEGPSFEAPAFRDYLIPAADRIVSKLDNSEPIEAIQLEIAEIKRMLSEDNYVGNELADGREIIENELNVAGEVLGRERFRLASLWGWLLPALRFLSKRFAGTSMDEAAKRRIDLLESLT